MQYLCGRFQYSEPSVDSSYFGLHVLCSLIVVALTFNVLVTFRRVQHTKEAICIYLEKMGT